MTQFREECMTPLMLFEDGVEERVSSREGATMKVVEGDGMATGEKRRASPFPCNAVSTCNEGMRLQAHKQGGKA